MNSHRLKVAIAGIGGYAGAHHKIFEELEAAGVCQVIATCDPALPRLGESCQKFNFSARGVDTVTEFSEMMTRHATQLDVMVLSTPLHLHAPMHAACVDAGLACYLEKPPTLDPVELERMIAKDREAKVATNVGFHYIHQAARRGLKQRMLDGEFGAFLGASYRGLCRRPLHYYQRNGWAGKLMVNGNLLLDSCCGNAMAHQLNNILFFAGQDSLDSWASPTEISAELYRANDIEGTDTVFASCRLKSGHEIRIAASHACAVSQVSEEKLIFERASIDVHTAHTGHIRHEDGRVEEIQPTTASLKDNVADYLAFVRGEKDRPVVTLEDSRAFVHLDALLYAAVPYITTIPAEFIEERVFPHDTLPTRILRDIEEASSTWVDKGVFPSAAGYAWAKPGGSATVDALADLEQAVRRLMN